MALNILQRFQRMLGRKVNGRSQLPEAISQTFDWEWEERRDLYSRWESLYANSIYLDQKDGGFREIIVQEDLNLEDTTLSVHGYYNPIACIVDSYQNVFRGQFGREIKVAPTVGGTVVDEEERNVNEKILDPISRMYRWSNLNDRKETMQMWCALNGAVGLRIEAPTIDGNGAEIPNEKRKVRIRPIHPREIVDFDEENGNIKRVLLEYSRLEGGLGEDRDDNAVTYTEELSTERFVKKREEKVIFDIENQLKVCPFVILRHKDAGAQFGVPAHFGTERILHLINWLLTRCSISVDRHVFAKWFAAAAGTKPENFSLGDTDVAYVQMNPGDTAPKLEAIVAKLDFNGIKEMLLLFIAHLRQRQPELVLSALEAMSGQSGETIAKLLIPIEERVLIARGHYEHALVRATQIGLSWGILNNIWDVGTGMGSPDVADRAYEDGLEDFQFNQRSALPETVFDRIKIAEADAAEQAMGIKLAADAEGIVSRREQMRMMKRKESDIEKIMQEKKTEDVLENPPEPSVP